MHLTKLASLHRLTPDASLLVNALSGAVDLVNNDLRTRLLELGLGGEPALSQSERRALGERGYLFADEGGERAALRKVYEAYERLSSSRPLQFVVCPTYHCNLACTYCFESEELRARPEVMDEQQIDRAFAAMGRLAEQQPGKETQVVLFGGEPLLPITEPAVEAVVQRAARAEIPVQVVTNGTYLKRFVPLFRRYPGTVRGAQVTLDGPAAVHDVRRKWPNGAGTFSQIVAGVDACLDAGIEVSLRVNLDRQNLPYLEDTAQLLEERGWAGRKGFRCQLAPVTDHVGTSTYPYFMREDELARPVLELWHRRPELKEVMDFQLFRVLHHLISVLEPGQHSRTMPRFHYCEADRGDMFTFGPDGLVYICSESIGDKRHAVGSYSPDFQMWPGRLKEWQNRSILTLPECQQCNIATFCGGGCAYAALKRFGSPAHGVCEGAPEVFKAYVESLRERWESREAQAVVET